MLAVQFCNIAGIATPELSCDEDGVVAFSACVGGVDFAVSHDPIDHPDEALIHVFFGTIPTELAPRILRELMQTNFQMHDTRAPVFSLDPLSDQVVLRYVYALAEASGEHLLAGMHSVAGTVLAWRQDFSFEDHSHPHNDFTSVEILGGFTRA